MSMPAPLMPASNPPGPLRMAFISPVFLFPNDTGGRIRTTNILRGLKGGRFHVTLASPGPATPTKPWHQEIDSVCDRFVSWPAAPLRPRWMRAWQLLGRLPVNVAADRTGAALQAVRRLCQEQVFDLVVFDFVHATVLVPDGLDVASVCFTHNVEAEIFARHARTASNPVVRAMWTSQAAKMRRFEEQSLARFDRVVAVSQRDADQFVNDCGLRNVSVIPTGVDLDFFQWAAPAPIDAGQPPTVVFTGSMDWDANIDGVASFLDQAWPSIRSRLPDARFVVVGRRPPSWLVERARQHPGVTFTGFVDDIRPHVRGAHVAVIPLRVGGGTRIKAFEAMALGCPVVSTAVGIEGLSLTPGEHFLLADDAATQADAVVSLLTDAERRQELSVTARRFVQDHFGHRAVASVFEQACALAVAQRAQAGIHPSIHPPAVTG